MASFDEKLATQAKLEQKILRLVSNFKKEPKRSLRIATRLREWYDHLKQLWDDFKAAHAELGTFDNELIASEYFVNRHFENIQAKYETMKEKIETLLNEQAQEAAEPTVQGDQVAEPTPQGDQLIEQNEAGQ